LEAKSQTYSVEKVMDKIAACNDEGAGKMPLFSAALFTHNINYCSILMVES
jgi:hypothetical protein